MTMRNSAAKGRPPEWDSLSCPQRRQLQYSRNFHQRTSEAVPVRALPKSPSLAGTPRITPDLQLRRATAAKCRPPEWDSLSCPQRKQFQYSRKFHQRTAEAVPVRALPKSPSRVDVTPFSSPGASPIPKTFANLRDLASLREIRHTIEDH